MAAKTNDEERQRVRREGYDAGWEAAWEIVTGGTAVELPWPERLRLIKRITEGREVFFGDSGTAIITYLSEQVSEDDQMRTVLPVPEYEELSR